MNGEKHFIYVSSVYDKSIRLCKAIFFSRVSCYLIVCVSVLFQNEKNESFYIVFHITNNIINENLCTALLSYVKDT